jgi:hypothetical protein
MVSIIPVLGIQAGFVLSGAVYIEIVFQWPGVGRMLVDAILARHPAGAGRRRLRRGLLRAVQHRRRRRAKPARPEDQDVSAFLKLLARNRLALGGLIVMGAVVLLALLTPLLPLPDPDVTDTANRFSRRFPKARSSAPTTSAATC